MLDLPRNRTLAGLRRLVSTEGCNVTLIRATRRLETGGRMPIKVNHKPGVRMRPIMAQGFGTGVSFYDGQSPLVFVHPSWWTYSLDDDGNTLLATKHWQQGTVYLEYAIDFPDLLDTPRGEPDTLQELEGK